MGLFDSRPDISEEDLTRIMEWMRNNRWSVSDTPGMGNVPAWSIANSRMLAPSGYGYPLDKEYIKQQKDLNRHLPYLRDMDARREAEGQLLDQQLGATMEMWDRRKPGARGGMLPIHHEQSETVQRPDGKWMNIYGRNTPRAGQQLPNTVDYDTVEEAVQAARQRSESQSVIDGMLHPRRTPRKNRHGGGGVRG